MDEIPGPLKRLLIINGILALILAFLYIGILSIILDIISLPSFDRLYSGVFGGTLLILGIFALLVVNRKEFKQVILFLELIIAWEIMILFINIFIGIVFTLIPLPLIVIWINNIIFLVMIIINIYFYRKYR